jgi:hypothetical protein
VRRGEGWIREHLEGAPAQLVEAMIAALPADAPSDQDALAEGAITLYGEVLTGNGGRDDALPLLAADALLTHAFQACAEREPEALAAFADTWGGGGRLGAVPR